MLTPSSGVEVTRQGSRGLMVLLHVRFPWRRDIGALSRNNGIVQHCYVSLATKK
jgi:hypothetical protein